MSGTEAETIPYEARGAVALIVRRRSERSDTLDQPTPAVLETALDIDALIEGEGMPTKRRFLKSTRMDGPRAVLAWREARAAVARQQGAQALEPASGKAHLPNVT